MNLDLPALKTLHFRIVKPQDSCNRSVANNTGSLFGLTIYGPEFWTYCRAADNAKLDLAEGDPPLIRSPRRSPSDSTEGLIGTINRQITLASNTLAIPRPPKLLGNRVVALISLPLEWGWIKRIHSETAKCLSTFDIESSWNIQIKGYTRYLLSLQTCLVLRLRSRVRLGFRIRLGFKIRLGSRVRYSANWQGGALHVWCVSN